MYARALNPVVGKNSQGRVAKVLNEEEVWTMTTTRRELAKSPLVQRWCVCVYVCTPFPIKTKCCFAIRGAPLGVWKWHITRTISAEGVEK